MISWKSKENLMQKTKQSEQDCGTFYQPTNIKKNQYFFYGDVPVQSKHQTQQQGNKKTLDSMANHHNYNIINFWANVGNNNSKKAPQSKLVRPHADNNYTEGDIPFDLQF